MLDHFVFGMFGDGMRQECRHKQLMDYFQQDFDVAGGCGACDVCKGEGLRPLGGAAESVMRISAGNAVFVWNVKNTCF